MTQRFLPFRAMLSLGLLLLVSLGAAYDAESTGGPSLHISFERYVDLMKTINSSPFLQEKWQEHVNLVREDTVLSSFRDIEAFSFFTCNGEKRSSTKPSSVHRLLPGDIDVVAALGDSLTAGNGARAWTILGCLTNYRGRVWSIGGDNSIAHGVTTLPNILRQFNPRLKGFSVGSGDENSSGAGMNVAVAGNVAQDMPGQAWRLVGKMRADPSIDFNNDWKMVTMFIGGNNLCAFCEDLKAHSAETYAAKIADALDILRDNLPRTFVNLVEIFDIAPVTQLGKGGLICNLVHSAVCDCGHGSSTDTTALSELSRAYQRAVQGLVDSGRYNGKEDFTVVNQPFFRDTSPPTYNGQPDFSFFAPDCFHFSEKGHNAAGKALWNTLIQPIGSKNTEWRISDGIYCPSTRYLPTNSN